MSDNSAFPKFLLLCFGIGLVVIGLYIRQIDDVGAQTPIDTVSNIGALGHPSQHRTWYDGFKHWVSFYSEGDSQIEFWSSSDGISWVENVNARLAAEGPDYSVEANGSEIYVTYRYNGGLFVAKGLVGNQMILRPNGQGDVSQVPFVNPEIPHWDAVNDVEPDAYDSYIGNYEGSVIYEDQFTLSDPFAPSGAIEKIDLHYVCTDNVNASYRGALGWGGQTARGLFIDAIENTPEGFTHYAEEWLENPFTELPWEWADLEDLQAGVALRPDLLVNSSACTQMYVSVTFEPNAYPSPQFTFEEPVELVVDTPPYSMNNIQFDAVTFNPTSEVSTPELNLIPSDVPDIYLYATFSDIGECIVASFHVTQVGDINPSVIDFEKFELTQCYQPVIASLGNSTYGITYTNGSSEAFLSTFTMDNDGLLSPAFIDTTSVAPLVNALSLGPSNNGYATVSYNDANGSKSYLVTIDVKLDGTIEDGNVDSSVYYTSESGMFDLRVDRWASGISTASYFDYSAGYLSQSFSVNEEGVITLLDFMNYLYSSNPSYDIAHVSGDLYALAYQDESALATIATFNMDSSGLIGDSLLHIINFDGGASNISISPLADDKVVLVFSDGKGNRVIDIVEIASDGLINGVPIDTLVLGEDLMNEVLKVSDSAIMIGSLTFPALFETFEIYPDGIQNRGLSISLDNGGLVEVFFSQYFSIQNNFFYESTVAGTVSGMTPSILSYSEPSNVVQTSIVDLGVKSYGFWINGPSLYGSETITGIVEGEVNLGTLNSKNSFSAVKGTGGSMHLAFINDLGQVVYRYFDGVEWNEATAVLEPLGNNESVIVSFDQINSFAYVFWLSSTGEVKRKAVKIESQQIIPSESSQVGLGISSISGGERNIGEELFLILMLESESGYSVEFSPYDISSDPFIVVDPGDDGTGDGGTGDGGTTDGGSTGGDTTGGTSGGTTSGGTTGGTSGGTTSGGTTGGTSDGGTDGDTTTGGTTDGSGDDAGEPPLVDDGNDTGSSTDSSDDAAQKDEGFQFPVITGLSQETKEIISKSASLVSQSVVVTSTATATVAVLGISAALFNEIPAVMLRWFFALLGFLRLRKRGVPIGFAYNSITKDPISGVIVRIYDEKGALIRTDVTNYIGVFYAEVDPGKYKIIAKKSGYKFPSQIVKGTKDDEIFNLYRGDLFKVGEKGDINFAIAMDPVSSSSRWDVLRAIIKNRLSKMIATLLNLMVIIGLLSSLIALLFDRDSQNILIFIVYIYAAFISYLSMSVAGTAGYGTVRTTGGIPVEGIKIALRDLHHKEIVSRRKTDDNGLYRFVVNKGEYRIELDDKRFMMDEVKGLNYKIVVHKDRTVIKVDFEIRHKT